VSSGQQNENGAQGLDTEDGDGETETSWLDLELHSGWLPVDGSHGPGDTDSEEYVDSIGSSHITHRVIGGVVLNSGGLGGEGI